MQEVIYGVNIFSSLPRRNGIFEEKYMKFLNTSDYSSEKNFNLSIKKFILSTVKNQKSLENKLSTRLKKFLTN